MRYLYKKKKNIFIILSISSFFLTSLHGSATPGQNQEWVPLKMQNCGFGYLKIFKSEIGENQDIQLEIEITNITNMRVRIETLRKGGAEVYPIASTDIQTFALSVTDVAITLKTTLGGDIFHITETNGQFRINNGNWQSFELRVCEPTTILIFWDENYVNSMILEFNITKMTGELEGRIFAGDDGSWIDITETGVYSYNITAHYIRLNCEFKGGGDRWDDEEHVVIDGFYKITVFHKERRTIDGFIAIFLIPAFFFLYKWKAYKK